MDIKKILSYLLITLVAILTIGLIGTPKVSALSGNQFQAGRIIDDGIFFNANGMSESEIQAFLNAKVPVCDTNGTQPYAGTTRAAYSISRGYPPPFICLKDFRQDTTAKNPEDALCNGHTAGNKTAARIIYEVAQSCGVNPKVLLVLLQKEQSLITDDWPWPIQYRSATGYGCPDTAPCDAQYYGFFNQVYNAARIYKYYAKYPNSFNHLASRNNSILYNPNSGCGRSTVFIQNQATAGLYNYTPYQPNAAALNNLYGTGDNCSAYGNRNFWRMFSDWFGSTQGPYAFKSSTSSTIYLHVGGYKLAIPHTAILQDFGVSIESIQTITQAQVDAIPNPSPESQVSSSLNHVIKSTSDSDDDGGSIYLVSRGKKYRLRSMDQFFSFGFSESQIKYVPLGFLYSIPGNGLLSNYIQSPVNAVFQVAGSQKRIIFDYNSYISLNPANDATPVSYFIADLLPSGMPLSNKEILVKYASGDQVFLYINNQFYGIPTFDSYTCWGFEGVLNTPVYRVASNSYISPIVPASSLSCSYKTTDDTTYLLSQNKKFVVPSLFGVPASTINSDLLNIASKLPSNSGPLKRYIKSNAAAVWYIDSGIRRVVPTYSNFLLLGIGGSSIDIVSNSSLSAINPSGIKLATGQLVKSTSSSAVFVVAEDKRVLYSTSNDFVAYHNSWGNIETYSTAVLNQYYPFTGDTVNKYLHRASTGTNYLVEPQGCYLFSSNLLTHYGQNESTLSSSQAFNSDIFKNINLTSCKQGSQYAKSPSSSLVYFVNNGVKHPITTWATLVSHSGQSDPYVITVSPSTLQDIPTSTAI